MSKLGQNGQIVTVMQSFMESMGKSYASQILFRVGKIYPLLKHMAFRKGNLWAVA